jgi:hypothetical protein
MKNLWRWVHWGWPILALALCLGGCGGRPDSGLERASAAYMQNVDHMMHSPNPNEWNTTDWGLWIESQGS